MKIIFDPKLKKLAERLGEALAVRSQISDHRFQMGREELVFVGRGMANKALKKKKKYPKTWEIGKVADSIDYLSKIILDRKTLEKPESKKKHRKSPEKIVTQKFDYDCGGAAVSTLLLMLGKEEVLKTDVYGRLEVNPIDGTKSINIKKLFDEEKVPCLEIWEASLTDVENILSNNGVVLVSYQAQGEPEEIARLECGHYSIIFDIDEEFVWLIDPSWEEEYVPESGIGVFKRERTEFEKLWIDKGVDGEIYNKWMLAVRVGVSDNSSQFSDER